MAKVHRSESKNLVAFFALAFAWSWLANWPRVLASAGRLTPPGWFAIFLSAVASAGPFVAAFGLTLWNEGGDGVRHLWERGWTRRFQKAWLVPALLLPLVLAVVIIPVVMLAGQSIQWSDAPSLAMIVVGLLLILFTNALPEEFGWRGYALDRFQLRYNALVSSLALGLLWGLWQLPLHWIAGTMQAAMPVWQNVVQVMAMSIIFTWLYNNTRGSIMVAILLHAASNLAAMVVPYWTAEAGRWIGLGLWVITAAIIVALWGPRKLMRRGNGGADSLLRLF